MKMMTYLILVAMLMGIILFTGCTQAPAEKASYSVDDTGVLRISSTAPVFEERVLREEGNVTLSAITIRDLDTTVYTLFATPKQPVAAIVFVPGAGVPAEGHRARAVEYAEQGIAFLVVDVRGNGGMTPGQPYSIPEEFERFSSGAWPQTYAVVLDLIEARRILRERYTVPVFVAGESRGGMYAALAAAADPEFSGYLGVSTGGYDRIGALYPGETGRFLKSIDPEYAITRITPRPVWVLHATPDTIIPFEDGRRLAGRAGEPTQFIPFNGTHGINEEADRIIRGTVLTFKGT
jgi:alpha-beta hydrolase superfamily lysophospholipase